jgi:RND superfamily putative drug exporter
LERWTRFVIRFRWPILIGWLVVLLAGGFASTKLSALLSNTFTVPGTDSERARTILERHYGDRSDGSFTVVYRVADSHDAGTALRLQAAMQKAAARIPTGHARRLVPAGRHVLYGDIVSTLNLATAKGYTDDVYGALPHGGGVTSYVTGQAAIQHDLDPIFSKDLRKGESIALPIALAVLIGVFGFSLAVTLPFLFAACTIMGTLGAVYLFAREMTMATYVTNLVQLIGLGIAIDYSLLVVYRFREELTRGDGVEEAIVRTMRTAGRAVVFSGATVAIGLALLLFMPLPFMRSIGVGGFMIPIVSILAAATLQPALLSVYGRRGVRRFHPLRRLFARLPKSREGMWARLAHAIMQRPLAFLAGGAIVLVAAAVPVYGLQLTPGSASGIPKFPQSVAGFDVLKRAVGPGALSPSQIVVDSGRAGGVRAPAVQASIERLAASIRRDPETAVVRTAPRTPFVDPSGRYEQLIVAGRHEYGSEQAQRFVSRLRGDLIPAASFPASAHVLAGGGPPQGVDFLHQAYRYFPWLVAAVLVLTYLLLMRAFRSVLLPLKAVTLNLLSVAASYGMLVLMFRWGVGQDLFGLYRDPQVEGWIPIFLFAMLFGLSMDYEVFLVTRMREGWDDGESNADAVAHGLERTGRIVTAAAIVMVAAFGGFVAGRIVGLQQFGLGLAVAIFLDATLVRALLVPSLMALFGRYNWWLPRPLARVVRVPPSPLERAPRPALRPAGK